VRDRLKNCTLALSIAAVLMPGCVGTDKDLRYINEADDVAFHKQVSQTIDYPDVYSGTAQQAAATSPPRTIASRRKDEVVDLTLEQAIQTALANNRIIRTAAGFRSGGSFAFTNPSSIYDPAIQESGVLFGGRGVEAALADFDTSFTTSMLWGRNEQVQNNAFFGGGLTPGNTLVQETGQFQSGLQKTFADSGSIQVFNNWNYLGQNIPGQLFPSTYTGNVGVQYTRPLWAGSGTEYTRIAGPNRGIFGGITGVSQGVVIARINNDITLADFEVSVRNLVSDVQNAYWNLYLAYRQYDTAVVARNSAKRTWQEADVKKGVGGVPGFRMQDEAQALDQYYTTQAQANDALNRVYTAEIELRRLMGLPVNDGRIFRPSNEPTMGEISPDWDFALAEALTRRVELRRQKWQIKSLELQLQAARSLTNPQLNFVSGYQVNGFGDKLISQQDRDVAGTSQGLNSAVETITQGNQTTWSLGFQFSMPLGFRSAKAQVQNIELRLLKAQQVLAAQELEISHELAVAFQNLAANYANMKANYERIQAAREVERIVQEQYRRGLKEVTADIVLRAQTARAQAESAFFTSRVNYDLAIADIEFRKGMLLEYYNVFLAEGPWTPQAYEQALRRARARTNALENHRLLHSEPGEFAYPNPVQPLPGAVGGAAPGGAVVPPLVPQLNVPPQPAAPKPPQDAPPPKPETSSPIQQTGFNAPPSEAATVRVVSPLGNLDGYQQDAIAPRTSQRRRKGTIRSGGNDARERCPGHAASL
jgi:outer membrane protein TolC